jgi:hypothetical protein
MCSYREVVYECTLRSQPSFPIQLLLRFSSFDCVSPLLFFFIFLPPASLLPFAQANRYPNAPNRERMSPVPSFGLPLLDRRGSTNAPNFRKRDDSLLVDNDNTPLLSVGDATAIKFGVLFGILFLGFLIIFGMWLHAKRRIRKGLAPLSYHRVRYNLSSLGRLLTGLASFLFPAPNEVLHRRSRTSRSTSRSRSTTSTRCPRPPTTRTCNRLQSTPGLLRICRRSTIPSLIPRSDRRMVKARVVMGLQYLRLQWWKHTL